MLSPFFGWDKLFYPVGEKDNADFIIVLYSRKCQCSCNLRHHILFHLLHRTEFQTTGNIHQQHNGQFTLFFEHLDIRLVEACGHVPVNVAYIVAKLIFAYFGECHTSTLESRMILACKDIVGQSARLDFNLTDFF